MVWYGMVEVCKGAPVAVSGWVLTDRQDLRPCAAGGVGGVYVVFLAAVTACRPCRPHRWVSREGLLRVCFGFGFGFGLGLGFGLGARVVNMYSPLLSMTWPAKYKSSI